MKKKAKNWISRFKIKWKEARIRVLKKKVLRAHLELTEAIEDYDCGLALARHMSVMAEHAIVEFNEAVRVLQAIDPDCILEEI